MILMILALKEEKSCSFKHFRNVLNLNYLSKFILHFFIDLTPKAKSN